MNRLQVSNLDAKFLRQLLEAVEAGELVLTDFTVSSEVEEVSHDASGTRVRLTGEKNWYITTRPAPAPVETPDEPPALVKRTHSFQELIDAVDTLLADYQGDRIQRMEFFRVAHHIGVAIVKASNQYPVGTYAYVRLVQLAARLGRAVSHG